MNSISQLHATSSTLDGAIVNVLPSNVHVAFVLSVTSCSIVSQSHALGPKSDTTSTVLLPVITHKFLLFPLNSNTTSFHVKLPFLSIVVFPNASLTITTTLALPVVVLFILYPVALSYSPLAQLYAFVGNHTHVSAAALITTVPVSHSFPSQSSNVYVGAVKSILFTTLLPLYDSFPFPSTALKHTYVPLSLSVLNTISLPSSYGIVALSHVSLVHVL